ncbi:NAD(P)-binding protein [Mycena sanguinolenta]|nr:NAD(P)-binding protein [Mycena sanguinolenta]
MTSLFSWLFPPSFLPERDMPDLSGKIVLVTGGNTGIGYETVKQLLLKNAKVYLAARSEEKATVAMKRLETETKKTAVFLQLDLADLPSVRSAAETFLAQESRIDLLFNNGGVMISPPEMLTAQGHDLQFGTNCIGPFFLTELLVRIECSFTCLFSQSRLQLPALLKTHAETGIRARVMHSSSLGHTLAPGKRGIEFESLKGGPERDAWVKTAGSTVGSWRLYGESKLGNVFVANYFAEKYGDVLVSCSLHPGGIKTELGRLGAYTQLWGATVADGDAINGQYLVPWGKIGKADARAADKTLQNEVINYVKEQTKGFL